MTIARIQEKELTKLREKARAHDAYLGACRVMGARQYGMLMRRSSGDHFAEGWLACLKDFSQAVADEGKEA